MTDSIGKPTLYVFSISHFCEKARFALDFFGVEHRVQPLAPGPHIKFCRSLGLQDTSVPVLVDGDLALQGSAKIVDWAQARHAAPGLNLEAKADTAACREIEARLDRDFGVHVRRYYYSEALLSQPDKVRPMFCEGLPFMERLVIRLAWRKICSAMIRGLDLGPEQGLESKAIVETELDWLDSLLGDGREFLVGDRFSRADLAAASLLSTIALPAEHPTYHSLSVPPGLQEDLDNWQQRPCIRWTQEMYRRYRRQ